MKLTLPPLSGLTYQSMSLGIFAGLATFLVLLFDDLTRETIAEQFRLDQLAGLSQVLPAYEFSNDLIASKESWVESEFDYDMFTGIEQESVAAYAVQTSVSGYAGPIVLLVGVDADQIITGVRVLSHSETPGLGDKMEIAKSPWVKVFEGHSLNTLTPEQWQVKKDGGEFDQFTGATITPRAIVKGIYQALAEVNQKLAASASAAPEKQAAPEPVSDTISEEGK